MNCPIDWDFVIRTIAALGTWAIALLALFGDKLKAKLIKLEISISDKRGKPVNLNDGRTTRYYHIKVRNNRKWLPAKNVRIMVTKILKPDASGNFPNEILSGPLQLTWQYPQFHPLYPTIGPDDICDLGLLIREDGRFMLSTYVTPNNFTGFIEVNQKMRVEIVAVSDNGESNPLLLEIAWNGQWSDDSIQMEQNLVIQKITIG